MRYRDFGEGAQIVELAHKDVQIKSNVYNFAEGLQELKEKNKDHLSPWVISEDIGAENYSFNISHKDKIVGQVLIYSVDRPIHGESTATLSFWVGEEHTNKGIGSTAVELACQYCFGTLDIDKVEAPIQGYNLSSTRLAQKVGFELVKRLPKNVASLGELIEHNIYVLYRDGYQSNLR